MGFFHNVVKEFHNVAITTISLSNSFLDGVGEVGGVRWDQLATVLDPRIRDGFEKLFASSSRVRVEFEFLGCEFKSSLDRVS